MASPCEVLCLLLFQRKLHFHAHDQVLQGTAHHAGKWCSLKSLSKVHRTLLSALCASQKLCNQKADRLNFEFGLPWLTFFDARVRVSRIQLRCSQDISPKMEVVILRHLPILPYGPIGKGTFAGIDLRGTKRSKKPLKKTREELHLRQHHH